MKIRPRQLFFLLACLAPLGKINMLPSQLAFEAKGDLLFPAAANILIQAIVIFFVLLLCSRQKTLYELLEEWIGKIAACILICIFAVFLLFAAILPLFEQKLMVQSVFYDTIPSYVAFAPFFLFSAYLCAKPLRTMGRMWDILGPIAIAGAIGIFVFAVGSADFGALQPVGAGGGQGFLRGSAAALSRFFDSALILSLVGKIDYEKGLPWKGTLCYLAGAAAVLLFLAIFYGVYAETAVTKLFAFSKVSRYFAGITVLGRIDFLFIYALALGMTFTCALPIQSAVDVLTDAFGKNKILETVLSVVFNAGLLLLTVLFNYNYTGLSNAMSQTLFWIFPIFTVAVPLLSLLLLRRRRE